MANRRMFAKSITCSSTFLMLPLETQAVYFQLGMLADDDGYCEYFSILRMIAATEEAVNQLATNGFLTVYQDYVLHLTHWTVNNQLRSDRYTLSRYKDEELQELINTGKPDGNQTATDGKPSVVKGSVVKVSEEKTSVSGLSKPDKKKELSQQVLDYFNEQTGRTLNGEPVKGKRSITLTGKTKSQIMSRIKEKYELVQFNQVTDAGVYRAKQDDEFKQYLHPVTLFNNAMDKRLLWDTREERLPMLVDHEGDFRKSLPEFIVWTSSGKENRVHRTTFMKDLKAADSEKRAKMLKVAGKDDYLTPEQQENINQFEKIVKSI